MHENLREKARLKEEAEAKELEMAGGGRWNEVGRKADMNRIESLYYMGVQRHQKQCAEIMNSQQQQTASQTSPSSQQRPNHHHQQQQGEKDDDSVDDLMGYIEDQDEDGPQLSLIEDDDQSSDYHHHPAPNRTANSGATNNNYHKSSLHYKAKNKKGYTSGAGDAYGKETSPSKQFKAKPLPKSIYGTTALSPQERGEEHKGKSRIYIYTNQYIVVYPHSQFSY